MNCNICQQKLDTPVYETRGAHTLTSLCEVINSSSSVYFCTVCGHCYTPPVNNLSEYYSNDYKILIESDEEDQLVFFPDGRKVFRFDLQVSNLTKKIDFSETTKLLDFGCAKSTTIKKLCAQNSRVIPYLFDVSDMYIPFWEKFIPAGNWQTFKPRPEWDGYFDVITSFFSLEHVADPGEMISTIHRLLTPRGTFYCVVPDMYCNSADFVVADHINHFSLPSIKYLLEANGFASIEIDSSSHYGAYIITAVKKPHENANVAPIPDQSAVAEYRGKSQKIATYWSEISNKIARYEAECPPEESIAIYGSGFYGAFIASCLTNIKQVSCFIDQNPYRQSQTLFERPIFSPENLPENIRTIYVGLNPAIAHESINAIEQWHDKGHIYNYL